MRVEQASVLKQERISGGYSVVAMEVPSIASVVVPGQFVHLLVPDLENAVLRRPFSIYRADERSITILYKKVGRGTAAMESITAGDKISIIGPLGNGFPACAAGALPVMVAGGYGVAPLALTASRMKEKGVVFIGGARKEDILCQDDFKALGWELHITTEDGSVGRKGLVTDALDDWMVSVSGVEPEFFACGPDGMMKALGSRILRRGWRGWFSLDKHMGCGVGACLACVQDIRGADGNIERKRVCKDGPVFPADTIVWS